MDTNFRFSPCNARELGSLFTSSLWSLVEGCFQRILSLWHFQPASTKQFLTTEKSPQTKRYKSWQLEVKSKCNKIGKGGRYEWGTIKGLVGGDPVIAQTKLLQDLLLILLHKGPPTTP